MQLYSIFFAKILLLSILLSSNLTIFLLCYAVFTKKMNTEWKTRYKHPTNNHLTKYIRPLFDMWVIHCSCNELLRNSAAASTASLSIGAIRISRRVMSQQWTRSLRSNCHSPLCLLQRDFLCESKRKRSSLHRQASSRAHQKSHQRQRRTTASRQSHFLPRRSAVQNAPQSVSTITLPKTDQSSVSRRVMCCASSRAAGSGGVLSAVVHTAWCRRISSSHSTEQHWFFFFFFQSLILFFFFLVGIYCEIVKEW